MMFRLQEQFQLEPNQNIIIEGTPNDLTYMITLLWCLQNGSIGFENEKDGDCKFVNRRDINKFDDEQINPRVKYPWVICNPTSKLFFHKPPTQTIVKRLPVNQHFPEVHRLFWQILSLIQLIFPRLRALYSL